MLANIGN